MAESYISNSCVASFVPQQTEAVFTHADLRPDNIMVDTSATGEWIISGSAHFESTKPTNAMAHNTKDDRYLYLPEYVDPTAFPVHWLVDLLWWPHIAWYEASNETDHTFLPSYTSPWHQPTFVTSFISGRPDAADMSQAYMELIWLEGSEIFLSCQACRSQSSYCVDAFFDTLFDAFFAL
jgi:hypothetical protein